MGALKKHGDRDGGDVAGTFDERLKGMVDSTWAAGAPRGGDVRDIEDSRRNTPLLCRPTYPRVSLAETEIRGGTRR